MSRARLILALANLALLGFFKYFNFLNANLARCHGYESGCQFHGWCIAGL